MSESHDLYRHYLRVLERGKLLLVVPTLLGLVAGGILIRVLPPTYRASTLVILETSKAPAGIPAGSSSSIQENLKTLPSQLASPSRIHKVIEKAGVLPRRGESEEGLVGRIARGIRPEMRTKDSFEVIFTGSERHFVRDVTNAIAQVFIEESSQAEINYAEAYVNFLENDLAKKGAELQEKERAISEFRQKYLGMMPEQTSNNATRLGAVSQQQDLAEQKLQVARSHLAEVQSRVTESRASQGTEGRQQVQDELDKERANLAQLLISLTDKHPDVVASRSRIARLEERLASLPMKEDSGTSDAKLDPRLRTELEEARREVERMEAQAASYGREFRELNRKLEEAPRLQAEFEDLNRGSSALDESYRNSKKQLENARTWLHLEKENKGQRFVVLDEAKLPSRPNSPDPFLVIPLCLAVGLGVGVALVLARETFDTSFHAVEELADATGVEVLAAVASITTARDERRKRLAQLGWIAVSFLVVLFVGWAVKA